MSAAYTYTSQSNLDLFNTDHSKAQRVPKIPHFEEEDTSAMRTLGGLCCSYEGASNVYQPGPQNYYQYL